MKRLSSAFALALIGVSTFGCNGTTGDELITFPAYAAGASDAGEPFSAHGYTIHLTYARMYVGAIYVNEAPAQNGSTFDSPVCIDSGVYCAQVPDGREVDLLSTEHQRFPGLGNGSAADLGQSFQLYLVDGDVNQPAIDGFGVPNTADLIGTATRESDGKVFSWAATVTINASNARRTVPRRRGSSGLNPIYQQRIVNLSGIHIQFEAGGALPPDDRSEGFGSRSPSTSLRCPRWQAPNARRTKRPRLEPRISAFPTPAISVARWRARSRESTYSRASRPRGPQVSS